MPFWLASLMGGLRPGAQGLTLGLAPLPITADQVRSLRRDNVVAEGAKGFADLGIAPTSMEAVLPEYLWRFRPVRAVRRDHRARRATCAA